MIVARDLYLECPAAPTLWTAKGGGKGALAIRFRWGWLSVRLAEVSGDPWGDESRIIFDAAIDEDENRPGREGDSCIGELEMKAALCGTVEFTT